MIDVWFTHAWTQLAAHVHDLSVTALALAVAALGVVLLMELRSVLRLRHVVDSQLGRIFEQLDLLSFETQQLLEAQQSVQLLASPVEPPTINAVVLSGVAGTEKRPTASATTSAAAPAEIAPAAHGALSGRVYQNAAALAATGASSREIAERLGLASGEARLLSSLAQARARRAESVSA